MNQEVLAIIDYLERDRGLGRELISNIIEESLLAAARKVIGPVNELSVKLDTKTGDIYAAAQLTVVESIQSSENEIALDTAKSRIPSAQLGDVIEWEVTPENFGRIAARTAKKNIMQRLREEEEKRICEEYLDQIGTLLYGSVTRYEKGNFIVNFGRTEGILRPQDCIPSEDYYVGDHLTCLLTGLDVDNQGPMLIVSRADPRFVIRLLEREVSEISDNIIEVKSIARNPGYRSKVAVYSSDPNVDPVGACVGMRGIRIKAIVRELHNEKIDIIPWHEDIKTFISNSLRPVEVKRIDLDEDSHEAAILVEESQLSLAIGKRGQNARISSKLTGWKLDIIHADKSKNSEFESKLKEAIEKLAQIPGLDETVASCLVHNGFLSVDGIRAADIEDIANLDGIDLDTAKTIQAAVQEE